MTGLVILLPFLLSLLIFIWLVEIFTAPFMSLVEGILVFAGFPHEKTALATLFLSRILIIVSLVVSTFLIGYVASKYLGSYLIKLLNLTFLRTPGIRPIYRFCQSVTHAVFSATQPPFKESVLISFPHKNALALGLVTGSPPDILKKHVQNLEISVFIPTAPHPISGFILMTSKNCTCPVDMTTEEVFKFIVSCGIIPPEPHHTKTDPHD